MRLASAAVLLRRLRAGTNHFSPNFAVFLHRGRAGLNVSLDGCSPGGLYLDDGVLRGAYLKIREDASFPSVPGFLSLPVPFFRLLSRPNSFPFFPRPLNFTLRASCLSLSPSLRNLNISEYSWQLAHFAPIVMHLVRT